MVITPVPSIDVHTHVFPQRLQAAVRRAMGEMYGWSFEIDPDPATFAAFLRDRNTERFCILPYAHKPGMARSLNAWVLETAASIPGAIPFACVHQDDDVAAVLDEAFDAGARGVKLHHQVQLVAPDDPRLFPAYEVLIERDLPVLAHAGRGPTDAPTVGAEKFERMMRRYPDLRACVAHMGMPEAAEFLAMTERFPHLCLDTSGIGWAAMGLDIEGHIERIVYGSDAPNIPFAFEQGITQITALGLGDEAEALIFRGNAQRLMRL